MKFKIKSAIHFTNIAEHKIITFSNFWCCTPDIAKQLGFWCQIDDHKNIWIVGKVNNELANI